MNPKILILLLTAFLCAAPLHAKKSESPETLQESAASVTGRCAVSFSDDTISRLEMQINKYAAQSGKKIVNCSISIIANDRQNERYFAVVIFGNKQ